MKAVLAIVAVMVCTAAQAKGGSHSVAGHTTKDGTSVAPHMATNPNATKLDNWSTKGNVNPSTGSEGTKDPYETPLLKEARPIR